MPKSLNQKVTLQRKQIEERLKLVKLATSSSFSQLEKPHNLALTKLSWYKAWHENPWVPRVHALVLTFYSLFMLTFLTFNIFGNPFGVKAATSYYVSKTSCSDSYPGTQAQPWCTIQHAADTVTAGDTVNVGAGTYDERVKTDKQGTSSEPITLRTTEDAVLGEGILTKDASAYWIIDGFTIGTDQMSYDYHDDTGYSGSRGVLSIGGTRHIVRNITAWDVLGPTVDTYIISSDGDGHSFENIDIRRYGPVYPDMGWNQTRFNGNVTISGFHWEAPIGGLVGGSKRVIYHMGAGSTLENFEIIGPVEGVSVALEAADLTLRNGYIYKDGRRVGTGWHTEHVGSFSYECNNLVIDGVKFVNPSVSSWVDGPYTWEPSSIFIFFGGNGQDYHNITIKNSWVLGGNGGENLNGRDDEGELNNAFTDVYMYNNIFDSNGVISYGPNAIKSNILFRNNIVGRSSIRISGGVSSDYNLFWDDYNGSVPVDEGSHSFVGETDFVNYDNTLTGRYGIDADWHLNSDSDARSAGIGPSSDSNVPTTDKDGVARSGTTTDIGAYMYQDQSSSNPTNASELGNLMKPASNPTDFARWWDTEVPTNSTYLAWFFDSLVPSDSEIRSMFWDKAVPFKWRDGWYFTKLWDSAVPNRWTDGYYFRTLWDKSVPDMWTNKYYFQNFWDKAVPNHWSSSYYTNTFWQKAIPNKWANSYYLNTTKNKAIPNNWAGGYYRYLPPFNSQTLMSLLGV
jgi:hypothetical protein